MLKQLRLIFDADYKPPLVVCWGKGVDSTAVLVGLHQRGVRPDMILFADVGSEKRATREYNIDWWFDKVGFPRPVSVRYQPKNYKNWPHYHTLKENCLTNVTLPSIAYGRKSCSSKWKISPMNTHLDEWGPAQECWTLGYKVRKAIGFEDSPHEHKRREKGCATFAVQDDEVEKYDLWFPLQEWHWDRDRCKEEILSAGLKLPVKSSCYFCTAMKPEEVEELEESELWDIIIMEARTRDRHLNYAEAKGWPNGVGIPLTEGLWRKSVKGMRGAIPHPGSITEYIKQKELLPVDQVNKVIAAVPTVAFTKDTLGFDNWSDWITKLLRGALL